MFNDGTYEAETQSMEVPEQSFPVEFDPGTAQLSIIKDQKHGQQYQPPSQHLGSVITGLSPVDAARLALKYYENILTEARAKF